MKTIKTETHILLVDETAEIRRGDWFYSENERGVVKALTNILHGKDTGNFKIIAVSPKIEGIPEFETLLEDDVEKLATNYVNTQGTNYPISNDYVRMIISQIKNAYKAGYKQAKSETMFSLEDVSIAIKKAHKLGVKGWEGSNKNFSEILRSLTKPKEYEFVPEMEEIKKGNFCDCYYTKFCKSTQLEKGTLCKDIKHLQPKIINNKIQGTWIIK